jgi:hypothetical protein
MKLWGGLTSIRGTQFASTYAWQTGVFGSLVLKVEERPVNEHRLKVAIRKAPAVRDTHSPSYGSRWISQTIFRYPVEQFSAETGVV